MLERKKLVGLSGGDALRELLYSHDAKHIFGYPGGAALPLFDGIYNASRLEFILVRHEQGAGHMAEGYARASGKPGVVLVTSGPGSSNVATPMLNALLDGTPMVVICGQVATAVQGTGAFQEIDIMGLAKPCTKWATCVQSVGQLPDAVDSAFRCAMDGRQGPTLVAVPKDVGRATFDLNTLPSPHSMSTPLIGGEDASRHNPEVAPTHSTLSRHRQLDRVSMLINSSQSPVVIAGNGVLASPNGINLISQLAEKGCIPVTSTLLGLGCFAQTHPLSVGMVGTYGAPPANLAVQNADLILAIGARLDERVVGNPQGFALSARVKGAGGIIQFDISSNTIGKVVQPTEIILGDLSESLPLIIPDLKYKAHRRVWLARINRWKTENTIPRHLSPAPNTHRDLDPLPQQVVAELNRQTSHLKHNLLVSSGVGQHQMWAAKYLEWHPGRPFITSGGLGTMGFGLPAAIGAKLAQPDCEVIDIDGDASFCMTMAELLTASQHGVAVKVIILNNSQQGMITQLQRSSYGGRECHARQANPDFVALAHCMDCQGARHMPGQDLSASICWLLRCQSPAVLEVAVAKTEMVPIVTEGGALDEIKLE
ncbi:thiamine pyrophosphate-binding protein [Aspergillus affinis]|uniref:thiamine pyrophosphate-binding protein n=1 Tax=Aspergillus affinis TaxID=1070780 RepID=UPI0022FE667B|nr:acetolactate synthase [Aspergillus affinis]KAI9042668.1 acetolactate synthase [Aspergillus affinis]